MMLTASPEDAATVWIVALPETRPFALQRSINGGSDWETISSISEAWTDATFRDNTVAATAFPLYRAIEE